MPKEHLLLNELLYKRFITMQTVVRDFLDFVYENNIESSDYTEILDYLYFLDFCSLIDNAVFHNKNLNEIQSKILNKELFKV